MRCLALLIALGVAAMSSAQVAKSRFDEVGPLVALPKITIDTRLSGQGLANEAARGNRAQARIIWVDGTANLDRVNTAEKIQALVAQIKKAGFNMIVFDVKPISGQTLYPSQYAPKIAEWKG